MKRTLLALGATLALASGSVLANEGFPKPSFEDAADLRAQPITGTQAYDHRFPKSGGANLGGPSGAATVLLQAEQPYTVRQAAVEPSFNG
ncbi:MAG TPA: hypothetical protein VEB41_09280 [Burkholderiales bacterium]|nr:hypothetical protein [Burkholderiales bacterium]